MKLFANNFALFFTVEPSHRHFRFERRSLAEIRHWLREEKLLFPGQVAWLQAEDTPDLLAGLLDLLRDKDIGNKYAQVNVSFADEKSRSALLTALQAAFKPIRAAGGLVFGPNEDLLLILRHGRWDLPKGKVEKGEGHAAAAWREVAEETGLGSHETDAALTDTFHVFTDRKGRWRLKTTHWYRMHCTGAPKLVGQTEEGITEVRWFPLADLRGEIPSTYPQIMDLIRMATAAKPAL